LFRLNRSESRERVLVSVRRLRLSLYAALAFAWAATSAAATLDVPTPYIPSTRNNVDEMLRLAGVRPSDVVYDLGSGDGRVVIAAAREWGARGVGIEIDPKLVEQANDNARREGVADRALFRASDVFAADVSGATVVTLYLLTSLVQRLEPKLLAELRPGTRIVAHDYGFAEWKPDRHVQVSKNFYLYIVPARIAGLWRLSTSAPASRGYELEFEQRYQDIRGGARVTGGFLPAFESHLSGDHIAFVLVDEDVSYRYEGKVSGESMSGTVSWGYGPRQQQSTWNASRTGPAAGAPR
jgi:SAM-dependent methyltransferase